MVKKNCFTLLELIMVVIIIGILASIALPLFIGLIEKTRSTEGTNVLGALRKAQVAYYSEKGNYTNNLSDLDLVLKGTRRFFNDPVAVKPVVYSSDSEIVNIQRNSTAYIYGAVYHLRIDVEGDIWCTGNNGVCTKIGKPTANP